MADVVLPVVGAAVGFVVGGPQGAMMGAQIGMMAASAFTRVKLPIQEGPRLADLRVRHRPMAVISPSFMGRCGLLAMSSGQLISKKSKLKALKMVAVKVVAVVHPRPASHMNIISRLP